MKRTKGSPVPMPTIEQVEAERNRLRYKRRYRRTLRSTVSILIVAAALAVLAATIFMPVLQIYGSSMTPTLNEGDIVVAVKGAAFRPGDLIAFYLGNKILVKRCIAGPGQWVQRRPIMDDYLKHRRATCYFIKWVEVLAGYLKRMGVLFKNDLPVIPLDRLVKTVPAAAKSVSYDKVEELFARAVNENPV